MFTLSKFNPKIIFQPDSYTEIDNILRKLEGRVLLINSSRSEDNVIVSKIKKSLKDNNITFIQSEQSDIFINSETLKQLKERAQIFNINTVISIGEMAQIYSGRFVSETPEIQHIEIPTTLSLMYMLTEKIFYSNRVKNDFEHIKLNENKQTVIVLDPELVRGHNKIDLLTEALTILLNLSHNFVNNNKISESLSRTLFKQITDLLKTESIDIEKLMELAVTAEFYNGTADNNIYELTMYAWVAGYRFNFNPRILCSKFLPYYLEKSNENELAEIVRGIIHDNNISSRIKDMGFPLTQLVEVCKDRQSIISLLEQAY